MGSAEREEQDGGEMRGYGDGGLEKEFSYRRTIPLHFLRKYLRRSSRLELINKQTVESYVYHSMEFESFQGILWRRSVEW